MSLCHLLSCSLPHSLQRYPDYVKGWWDSCDHQKTCPRLSNTFHFKNLFPVYDVDKLEAEFITAECLPLFVCQHLFKVLMQMSLLFLRHGKNVLFHCQKLELFRRELLMFESWNPNLSKAVPLEPEMCLRSHSERPVKWQLSFTCIACISGWGCSTQADLYLQLLKQLLGFLVALENDVFLLVALLQEHEEKASVKCRKLGRKNEEKDKPQRNRR